MNRLTKVLLPLVAVAILGCEEKSVVTNESITSKTESTPKIENTIKENISYDIPDKYAARGVDNSWPSLDDGTTAIDADGLTNKNYYIIFDGSGSMQGSDCAGGQTKISVAKKSIQSFIEQIPGDANIGIAGFDSRGTKEHLALSGSTKAAGFRAVNAFNANGGTPLKTAITLGYRSLKQQAQRQLGYGEYHLVVVTDGKASKGENPTNIVTEIANNSPVLIHTIGFCIGSNHSLNQTGVVLYKSAADQKSLMDGLEAVLAESENFDISEFSQ